MIKKSGHILMVLVFMVSTMISVFPVASYAVSLSSSASASSPMDKMDHTGCVESLEKEAQGKKNQNKCCDNQCVSHACVGGQILGFLPEIIPVYALFKPSFLENPNRMASALSVRLERPPKI